MSPLLGQDSQDGDFDQGSVGDNLCQAEGGDLDQVDQNDDNAH